MDWIAKWIWGGEADSPRNEWRCFRKTFDVPLLGWERSILSITADSRYTLYLNGHEVGRGPVRSWPHELSYDTYDLSGLLHKGKSNTIALAVHHLGVSNFQYIRGRGGLLAQIDVYDDIKKVHTIATDHTWRTTLHMAYEKAAARISCQLGFVERFDALQWNENWLLPLWNDRDWEESKEIGPVGMEPWSVLKERDIPFLTWDSIKVKSIERIRKTKPVTWSAGVDIRTHMVPESANHANPVMYNGYLAISLYVQEAGAFTVGLIDAPTFKAIGVDGNWTEKDDLNGTHPERYWEGHLEQGEHFILLDVSGWDHGQGFLFGIDSSSAFNVCSSSGNAEESPIVGIGPFDVIAPAAHPLPRELNEDDVRYQNIRKLSSRAELDALAGMEQLLHPMSSELIAIDDVFVQSVWKSEALPLSISHELQQITSAPAMPVVLPHTEGWETELLLDFGRQYSGYLEFQLTAPEGTVVDLYGFEYMHDGWIQHTYSLNNTMRYRCREGTQRYISQVRRGFRYVLLTFRNAGQPVKLHGVRMQQSNYPVSNKGTFECSDDLLNEVWEISRHTTRLCMEDTFVDCPAYEQAFWVGDSRNESLIGYYLFGAEGLVRRCLQLVPGSRHQTPLYANQVPSGWNSVIPNWTFFWVMACEEYFERTNDIDFLHSIWPDIQYTLNHYWDLRNDQGLFEHKGWNLLDWAPIEQPCEGVVTHQNMALVQAICKAERISSILKNHDESRLWNNRAEQLAKAINTQLWSEEKQAYIDCIYPNGSISTTYSMQVQVLAYLYNIAHGERRACIETYLKDTPVSFVPIGSPFMSFFYYEALIRAGLWEHMLEDIRKNYGEMIQYGATTCWETYASFQDQRQDQRAPTRSHCHAWSAAPAYVLGSTLLGIEPIETGWRKVVVAPKPSGVTWAQGSVPLPEQGSIAVTWKCTGTHSIHINVTAPPNIEVDIRLPAGYNGEIEHFVKMT